MNAGRTKVPLAGSLRLKLAVWLLAPLLLLLALDAYLTYQRAQAASNVAFDRVLLASAKQIQEGVRMREGKVEVDIPYLAFELFEASTVGRLFYRVLQEGGPDLTGYPELALPPVAPQRFYKPAYYDTVYQGQTVRAVGFRMPVYDLTGNPLRTVWIVVAETPDTRNELAKDILLGSVVQEAVLVLLAVGIFVIAGAAVLRPIEHLSHAVEARDEARPAPLETPDMPVELRPLVDALNAYTDRMQNMLGARRRFFDDAAHQLKTPLAVMQAQLELALRQSDDEAIRNQVRKALATLGSASDGVVKLLSLARLEPDNGRRYDLRACDLTAIARQIALDLSPIARANGVDLGFEGEASAVIVQGEGSLLQELIANLIDNAIRHAGRGSVVTVRTADAGAPRVEVVDNGPGIPEEHRAMVLRRFYRVPGTAREGSGLGLAIVREIARVHSARLSLESGDEGGLKVVVEFPAGRGRRHSTALPTPEF